VLESLRASGHGVTTCLPKMSPCWCLSVFSSNVKEGYLVIFKSFGQSLNWISGADRCLGYVIISFLYFNAISTSALVIESKSKG
jgi:hypothetical protein